MPSPSYTGGGLLLAAFDRAQGWGGVIWMAVQSAPRFYIRIYIIWVIIDNSRQLCFTPNISIVTGKFTRTKADNSSKKPH